MKKIIAEFKEFISKGSVIDLAVGVIIGGAFTAIVNSLVNDLVMPFIGWLIGGINFTEFKLALPMREGLEEQAVIAYGAFIQAVINFLLVALVIFILVKIINKFRKKKEEEPAPDPEPSDEVKLLSEIRDLLDEKNK